MIVNSLAIENGTDIVLSVTKIFEMVSTLLLRPSTTSHLGWFDFVSQSLAK